MDRGVRSGVSSWSGSGCRGLESVRSRLRVDGCSDVRSGVCGAAGEEGRRRALRRRVCTGLGGGGGEDGRQERWTAIQVTSMVNEGLQAEIDVGFRFGRCRRCS